MCSVSTAQISFLEFNIMEINRTDMLKTQFFQNCEGRNTTHQPLCNNIATAALSEKFPEGFFWIVIGRPTSYIPGFNVLKFLSSGNTKKA
jgi:hypothetical protein